MLMKSEEGSPPRICAGFSSGNLQDSRVEVQDFVLKFQFVCSKLCEF